MPKATVDPKIRKVFRFFGMPFVLVEGAPDFTWDGSLLRLAPCDANSSDMFHELAHWLICSKRRRASPEYGLGTSRTALCYAKTEMRLRTCNKEESNASALGIAIERHLGFDWERTVRSHNWEPSQLDRHWCSTKLYVDYATPLFLRDFK
jgi:hypothetical protein